MLYDGLTSPGQALWKGFRDTPVYLFDRKARNLDKSSYTAETMNTKTNATIKEIFRFLLHRAVPEDTAEREGVIEDRIQQKRKDEMRHVGYSGVDFGDGNRVIIGDGASAKRRTVEESMRALEEFIIANGRYPRWSQDDKEEYRLRHFVQNRRHAADHGRLSKEEADRWMAFEAKYRQPNMPVYRRGRESSR